MKSFSDELPNMSKDKIDQLAGLVIDVDTKATLIAIQLSQVRTISLLAIVLSSLSTTLLALSIFFPFHH